MRRSTNNRACNSSWPATPRCFTELCCPIVRQRFPERDVLFKDILGLWKKGLIVLNSHHLLFLLFLLCFLVNFIDLRLIALLVFTVFFSSSFSSEPVTSFSLDFSTYSSMRQPISIQSVGIQVQSLHSTRWELDINVDTAPQNNNNTVKSGSTLRAHTMTTARLTGPRRSVNRRGKAMSATKPHAAPSPHRNNGE